MSYVQDVKDAFDLGETDKGFYHSYQYMYGLLFKNYEPKTLLEIGVKGGLSIWAWQTLFPNCDVSGIDIEEVSPLYNKKPFNYMIGDSTTFDVTTLPNYDVIIDDGSHHVDDQIKTLRNFKDKFNELYVIEDINFTRHNKDLPDEPLQMLIEEAHNLGFYGLATFPSYNLRKKTRALVIMSKTF